LESEGPHNEQDFLGHPTPEYGNLIR